MRGVLRGENRYHGEEGMVESVAKAGEKFEFGLEEGEARAFVGKFGFSLRGNAVTSSGFWSGTLRIRRAQSLRK